MTRTLALACALVAVLGCRPPRLIPRAAPMPPPPERLAAAEGLLVFVAENTGGQLAHEESTPPGTEKAQRLAAVEEKLSRYGKALRRAVAETLGAAGVETTVDPWSGAELVATATSEVRPSLDWDQGGVSVATKTALVLSTPHGKPLARAEAELPASDEDVLDTREALDRRLESHARRVALELVRKLGASPELAAYLQGRRTRQNISALMKQEEEKQAASGADPRTLTDLRSARDSASAFVAGAAQPSSHGLVVGVEKYADGKMGSVGARSDATRFAGLMLRTLGLPEENIHLLADEAARRANLEKELAWLVETAKPESRVYLFFSGAEAVEPKSGAPVLLPHDRDASAPGFGLRLDAALKKLADTGAEVLAVVDACPVGKGKPRELKLPSRVVLIAAPLEGCAQGELALHLTEGLGTALADGDGDADVSLEELRDFVGKRVGKQGAQAVQFLTGQGASAVTFTIVQGLEKK